MSNQTPDYVKDVLDFHFAIGSRHVRPLPGVTTEFVARLKLSLVKEEYEELVAAVHEWNIPGIADSCADLVYVVVGLALAYGIDLRPVWEAIQKANLAKAGGPRRADGKLLKPPGWKHPDIKAILDGQAPLFEIQ